MKIIISVFMWALFVSSSAWAVDIGVMVIYNSDFSRVTNPGIFIQNQINYSNQVAINSGMSTRYLLVHHQELNLPNNKEVSESFRNSLILSSDLLTLRNQYRPDLVVYLTRSSSSLCGIAFFPQYAIGAWGVVVTEREMAARGVSVVGWDCSVDVFLHEIGHNLGAGHGPVGKEDHFGKPIRTSRGHGLRDVFRTVMAYSDNFGSAPVLAVHSNPRLNFNGLTTGTSERDNASGMDKVAANYVQKYSACFPARIRAVRPGVIKFECVGVCIKTNIRGACVEYLP